MLRCLKCKEVFQRPMAVRRDQDAAKECPKCGSDIHETLTQDQVIELIHQKLTAPLDLDNGDFD